MGDLHQPLHIGYSQDKGGNQVKVHFNNKLTNLHGLLDYGIIEYKELTLKQCLKSNTEKEDVTKGTVLDWAKESRSRLDAIYDTKGDTISETYTETNYTLIKSQLNKAGTRLAFVLKEVFKKS